MADENLAALFDTSHFDHNAFFRGAQLTVVGAHRVLQNPKLFTAQHYKQALIAVGCGIAISLLLAIPAIVVRTTIFFSSFFVNLEDVTWDDKLVKGITFLQESVLQLPLFLLTLMRHLTPALDQLFMDSLEWVDYTYEQKHKATAGADLEHRYYKNLKLYDTHGAGKQGPSNGKGRLSRFLWRFARKGLISLAVYALSYLPLVGRFVLPAASFYTFNKAVGPGPACIVFGTSLFLPRRYLVYFLQTYYASRTLMRELLGPYFARIRFDKEQKRNWFRSREGILFGFGVGFYTMLRVPLVGALVYGVAQASTAYLITKITDPPPPPSQSAGFAASQQEWRNKKEFLSLALDSLDALQGQPRGVGAVPDETKKEL